MRSRTESSQLMRSDSGWARNVLKQRKPCLQPYTEGMSDTPATPGVDDTEEATLQEGEGRPSRRSMWLAMGAVAVALGLIWLAPGIGVHQEEGTASERVTEYPGEPDDMQATGKPAPLHFTLKDMNGADVKLESFKGKVILVNFWATWC